ncbi:MAG TPA: hypothetical protein GXX26_12430 [Clostridiaceae bacterium]|nr:hypothetical protein [Clostridiaceae bacterium]
MASEADGILIKKLEEAFDKDGYKITEHFSKFGRLGIAAEHKTAFNYDTGEKKRVYYVEGTHYEMGYLLGFLAEEQIREMTGDFTDQVPLHFIGSKNPGKMKLISNIMRGFLQSVVKPSFSGQPQGIKDEIRGIADGCRERNPSTKVTIGDLMVLNLGFDILLSMVYTGTFLRSGAFRLLPVDFKVPLMCNAFSIFGQSAGGGHYFGRDFMFPSAGVFHRTAAMIIYNPTSENGQISYPFVSVTAPGIVGSISAMNIKGTGMGVDMSAGFNCSPESIGVNSLVLCRECIQHGANCDEIIKIVSDTKRGVSWNYIVSDGVRDRACAIEAGRSQKEHDLLRVIPNENRPYMPDKSFISQHRSAEYKNGMMVRWNDYKYPAEYLEFNKKLWNHYNKKNSANKVLYPDALEPTGFINRTLEEKNCPSTFYFAPQREDNDDLIIVTNHFIIPEMQFYSMHPWTSRILSPKINDIQWRYDTLNFEIMQALNENGSVNYSMAKKLIDFLAPYGKYASYYEKNPRSHDGREIRIEGCTSMFDLKNLVVESHFGYYCDQWIKITLPQYVL